jgi:hypothetical protein
MVVYEIHWLDEMSRDHLIGILPERRRKKRYLLNARKGPMDMNNDYENWQ